MRPHCEKFVLNQLPGVRALLVKDLMTRYSLTQTETARLTGITQAAVSQYMRSLRGKRITKKQEAGKEIKKIADELVKKKITKHQLNTRFCKICKIINK